MSIESHVDGWPAQCCVPAFLARSIGFFTGREELVADPGVRRVLAQVIGVTVSPGDPNPWRLPTSEDEAEWGVTSRRARETFNAFQSLIDRNISLTLDIIPLNEIAFQMYENCVIDLTRSGAVIGIGFEYCELAKTLTRSAGGMANYETLHLVRLTPLDAELGKQPNILSSDFKLDYGGKVWVFDDSSEIMPDEALVSWRALIAACRSAEGAFWAVRRA